MSKLKMKKKRKLNYLVLSLILFVGIYFAVSNFAESAKSAEFFKIKRVKIEGNRYLSQSYLKTVADSFKGENIFNVEEDDVQLRFQALSRVKDVKSRRVFPSTLKFTITERQGVFYVKDDRGEYYPIDEDMIVLDKSDWYLNENIPLINISIPKAGIQVGKPLNDPRVSLVFTAINEMKRNTPLIINDVSEFYFKNNDLYFVDDKSGCRVLFNLDNISSQLSRFIFLRNNQGFDRNSTIDLRFDTHVIIL